MTFLSRRFCPGLALLAVVALALACEEVVPTTQIVIVVDADAEMRESIAGIELETAEDVRQISKAALKFPFSFSLVPESEAFMGGLSIRAFDRHGSLIVTRKLEVAFRARRTLSYGVLLAAECWQVECPAEQSCSACAGCVDALVDPEALISLRHASQAISTWQDALTCSSESDASTAGP